MLDQPQSRPGTTSIAVFNQTTNGLSHTTSAATTTAAHALKNVVSNVSLEVATPPKLKKVDATTLSHDFGEANRASDEPGPQAEKANPQRLYSLSTATEMNTEASVKLFSALAFGVSSIAIMLIMKCILTTYGFHCFLTLGAVQYLGTIIVLLVQRNITHTVPNFPMKNFLKNMLVAVFPLPLLFLANTLSGLGATKDLSMPTFVLLRRFSIVMTLLLEWVILSRRPNQLVVVAVSFMVLGALIATGFDVTLKPIGVMLVLVNNLFTSLQGVVLRKKIDEISHVVKTEGILFYNNVFSFVVAAILIACNVNGELDRLHAFTRWRSPGFIVLLLLASVMGFILNYCMFMCTKLNSPLTTAMVGGVKNIITSYIGMIFSDYVFNPFSFAGLTLSVVGTVIYSRAELKKISVAEARRLEMEANEGILEEEEEETLKKGECMK